MRIAQNIVWILLTGLLFFSCNKESEKQEVVLMSDTMAVVLTDSMRLLKHIDSLPVVTKFPYHTSGDNNHQNQYREGAAVSFAEFKDKQLFNLPYQLISSDFGKDETAYTISDEDSTFNLTGQDYIFHGVLVAKKPEFILVNFSSTENSSRWLATISYQLKLIDAIRSDTWEGNPHFHSGRSVRVFSDLKLELINYYSVQTDQTEFASTEAKENWLIEGDGHIRKVDIPVATE